jgi:hypothetical protein
VNIAHVVVRHLSNLKRKALANARKEKDLYATVRLVSGDDMLLHANSIGIAGVDIHGLGRDTA